MTAIEIPMDDLVEIPFDDSVSDPSQFSEQPSHPREIPPSRRSEELTTLHWAAEIERSFTSTLWHHPEFLDLACRELDFTVHISISPYRKIIEALTIVFGDLGIDLDWTCVVHCVRELGAFDECGGLVGLNEIFTDCGHYPEGRQHPEAVIGEYIRLLKEYAIARGVDPLATVRRYTRGRGYLQKNKLATKPTHPTVVGKIERCCCGRRCTIAGWPGEQDTLNLTLTPER
jgi:hypothetical protein